jgi:hypothetical protein
MGDLFNRRQQRLVTIRQTGPRQRDQVRAPDQEVGSQQQSSMMVSAQQMVEVWPQV